MAVETDTFVIATMALWAGDFTYFRQIVRGSVYEPAILQSRAEGPEAIIEAVAGLRLRQLGRKRAEFKELAASLNSRQGDLTDEALVLQTEHLRATVWRTGPREFGLYGYLRDLKYESELFKRAQSLSDSIRPQQASSTYEADYRVKASGPAFMPLGAAWSVTGDLFIQAEVSDMGLLESTGLWTAGPLPRDSKAVSGPFMALLWSLDPLRRQDVDQVADE